MPWGHGGPGGAEGLGGPGGPLGLGGPGGPGGLRGPRGLLGLKLCCVITPEAFAFSCFDCPLGL